MGRREGRVMIGTEARPVSPARDAVSIKGQMWWSWPMWLIGLYGLTLAVTAAVGMPSAPVPHAPLANLLDKPFGEDAFYMFSVARNLGTGHGISYGGNPTTGVQPLATFLYASLYWLAAHTGLSMTAPLRLILLVNVALLILTGCLAGTLVSRWVRREGVVGEQGFWIAATIVVVNPMAFRLFCYGLETGLYLCAIVALQLVVDAAQDQLRIRTLVAMGLLIGVCILARLDFVIVGSVVFGWQLFTKRLGFRDSLITAAVAAVIVGPWLAYIYSVMGGIMPSSGAAQAGVARNAAELVDRSWVMTSALVSSSSSVIYLPISSPVPILSLLAVLLLVLRWIGPNIRIMFRYNAIWIVGAAVLALYYFSFSAAGHSYSRYLAPLWLSWTQLLAASLVLRLNSEPERHALFFHQIGGLALTTLFAAQIGYTIHRGHASNSHLFSAFYIQQHSAELGRVGAFQTGVIGYVNNERTINLDGKVDHDAFRVRGRLECYLAQRGITTVIDWPDFIHSGWIDPSFVRTQMRDVGRVPAGTSVIMTVNPTGTAACR
jgi:hypothetical protein